MRTERKAARRCIAALVFVLMAVLFALPVNAFADDKEYRVDGAEFTVKFAPNGDAEISEHWTVTYEKGSFTRFYKDIYNSANQLEYISDISVVGCKINGVDAEPSASLDRQDGHYYLEPQSDRFTIHWFKGARNETVNYDITYRIPQAVKLNESDRAEFCYRFIGDNFPKTVGSVKVTAIMPSEDGSATYTLSSGEGSMSGDKLYFSTVSNSGMYKVRVNMSREGFGELKRVIDVIIPESVARSADDDDDGDFVGAVVGFIFIPIAGLGVIIGIASAAAPKFRKKKVKNMLDSDPDCFRKISGNIAESGIPFVWYLLPPFKSMMSVSDHLFIFYAELFDLSKKGLIVVTGEGLRINGSFGRDQWDDVQTKMDSEFMDMLFKLFPANNDSRGTVIYFTAMKDTLANNSILLEISGWRKRYSALLRNSPLYKQLVDSGQIKQLKNDLAFWNKYAKYLDYTVNTYDCFSLLERTGELNSHAVLMMIYGRFERMATPSSYQNHNAMYDFVYCADTAMYTTSTTDSSGGSGCSSCSSCSSCGGCGGGGAD